MICTIYAGWTYRTPVEFGFSGYPRRLQPVHLKDIPIPTKGDFPACTDFGTGLRAWIEFNKH